MDDLRVLMKQVPARAALDFGLALASIVAVPIVFALLPNPFGFIAAFLLSVRTFNCFAQLVHMSDHGGLFPGIRLNRVAGNIAAYCLGYTRSGHRRAHLNHHLYLNTERDPDRIWGAPDETTRDLIRSWCRDFLFLSALERLLQYSQSDRKAFSVAPWRTLSAGGVVKAALSMYPVVLTQAVILGVYTVTVGPLYYFLVYVLPILTFYPAQIRLRSTVEHGFDAGYRPVSPEDYWVTRSTHARFLERFVFAPYGIQHHFEHHLFPTVPHYHLPKVRRLLEARGIEVPVVPGYLAFVMQKIRSEKLPLGAGQSA
jgi:fatty acid desaturase